MGKSGLSSLKGLVEKGASALKETVEGRINSA